MSARDADPVRVVPARSAIEVVVRSRRVKMDWDTLIPVRLVQSAPVWRNRHASIVQ